MEQVSGLAAMFLAHTKVRVVPPTDLSALDSALAQAWKAARDPWPSVELLAEPFVKHIAQRLPKESPPQPIESILARLSLPDLYLACACLQRHTSALELFEKHYLAKLPQLLRNKKHSEAMIEDICQIARVQILVSTPEKEPKIAGYEGRGPLWGWVRTITTRIAADHRSDGHSPCLDELADFLPAPVDDPETVVIWERYRTQFLLAMRKACSALSAEERHLLRLNFRDRLNTYELGAYFRVDQATISRRLKKIRQKVYDETRRHLQALLGLSTRDAESFLAKLDSQIDVRISQLLGKDAEDEPPLPPSSS